MKQYLLSIEQPDEGAPPREVLERMMGELGALMQEAKATNSWVFNGALHAPSTASVVRFKDGEYLTTDGPYTEGKEHVGGFLIIKAEDLDAALGWARRLARIITLPIEVRPFQGDVAP